MDKNGLSSIPPVFSIAREEGDYDVLYPNPYFGTPKEWEEESGALIQSARAHPWDSRNKRAFWRGRCSNNFLGSLARLEVRSVHMSFWV